jgi:biotin synthase-like enzyme
MIEKGHQMGYKQGMTVVIGLGETRDHFSYLEDFIEKHKFDRITVYALRPVAGTPFEHGPTPIDVAWWIAKIRVRFPKIEIIAGSAKYRIPEISLFLKAGANAITKLPASNIFNTEDGLAVEEEVKKAGRNFVSKFSSENVYELADWDAMINRLDLSDEERKDVREVLFSYLDQMDKRGKDKHLFDSCEL